MNKRDSKSIRVQVIAAKYPDAGKGTGRLSRKMIQELGLKEGDPIRIKGKKTTPALLLPPYPEDEESPVIRLDGLQRTNAFVSIGEHVEVMAADEKPAQRITVAYVHKQRSPLIGSGDTLLRTLQHRVIIAGDIISTAIYRQTKSMPADVFPESVLLPFFEQHAFGLQEVRLLVTATIPHGIVRITPETEINLISQPAEGEEIRKIDVTYDDVGGIDDAVEQIRELIEIPLKHADIFHRLGIEPPNGIMLHGPPGVGKTLLARAVAYESGAKFFPITGPETIGRSAPELEERLRNIFTEAQKEAPAIIFIEDLETIAPKRMQPANEAERRLVNQLLTLIDSLKSQQNVMVIGATSKLDSLDDALRRPGRLEREIVLGVPDQSDRLAILSIHTRGMPLAKNLQLEELARIIYGFVGADIASLTKEAAIETLRRNLPYINLEDSTISSEVLEKLEVNYNDFLNALKRINPSARREIIVQVPDVTWDGIGGLDEVKREIREGIELPIKYPDRFREMGIQPAKGFLLFGAPGTGKTMLAKAIAHHAGAHFIAATSSDILSKWYGESEKQIVRIFNRARQVAPTILFFDEIDALAPWRGVGLGEPAVIERVVNTLLAEMDALEDVQDVVIIGATNRPTLLDHALLRPGRFDELIYVPVPDKEGRVKILQIHTRNMQLSSDVNLEDIAERTIRYTGADLQNLVRRAGLRALREEKKVVEVSRKYFEFALDETRASVNTEMEEEYTRLIDMLKRESPRARPRIGFLP